MQQRFELLIKRVEATDEQHRQERKEADEERKQQQKKDIPKLAQMTETTDILEYMETFEENMEKRKVEREEWSGYLMPLLNNDCRTAALHLTQAEAELCSTQGRVSRELLHKFAKSWRCLLELRSTKGTHISSDGESINQIGQLICSKSY